MKTFLKLKIRSLRAEAALGYREAERWPKDHPLRKQIIDHANELSWEMHGAQWAMNFLRGLPWVQVAPKYWAISDALFERIAYNVDRFGGFVKGKPTAKRGVMQKFSAWLDGAKEYSSPEAAKGRRQVRDKLHTERRLAYKARFWRPEPTDQAKLKAELKAKWEGRAK